MKRVQQTGKGKSFQTHIFKASVYISYSYHLSYKYRDFGN